MGSDFADPKKRLDTVPVQPIKKPLQNSNDDIWPKPKKKAAGYGAGGYGKTVPGGLKDFGPYGHDAIAKLIADRAAASSGSEELTDTRIAQGRQGDVKDGSITDVDLGHGSLGSLSQGTAGSEPKLKPAPIQVATTKLTPKIFEEPLSSIQEPTETQKHEKTEQRETSEPKPKGLGKKSTLIAQLDGSGIQEDPVTKLFKVVVGGVVVGTFENLKAASDYLSQHTPDFGKEVFGYPAGPDESKFINKGAVPEVPSAPASAPTGKGVVQQPMPSVAPMPIEPMPIEPLREVKPSAFEQEQLRQQQQWKQEQQQQADQLQARQAAQTKLWAKQQQLGDSSAKLVLQQKPMEDFEAQLTPPQKEALTKAVTARYQDLATLAQQADNPLQKYEVADLHQQIRQQVLYERFVPVREIYHFGNEFLNGYMPQKMQAVRGYFDQVFEGSYAKSIPADKRAEILKSADAKYTQETGKKPNRESSLWKTYRNAETSEKYPDLWNQFRDDLSNADDGVMPTVVGSKDPNLGSNALNRSDRTQPLKIPDHTGHRPEQVDTESKGFDLDSAPKVPNDTAHRHREEPYITDVFAAKEGEIPGVDIPFRKVNPKYPANPDVLEKARSVDLENDRIDCSEIAEDLLKVAKGKGRIIQVLPSKGTTLTLYELGKKDPGFDYHQVYTDGQYIYDPRVSSDPIPKGDWEVMIRSLNPEAKFNYFK